MATDLDYSLLGSGRIYAEEIGGNTGLLEIGNCSAFGLAVEEDEKKLLNFKQGGGGTQNSVKRVTAVTANLTAHDVKPDNLARFGYGTKSSVAAGAVTGETAVGRKNTFVAFANLNDESVAPVVAVGTGAATRANTTAYALNALIVPAVPNGYYYKVTTAGTSGGTVPTFPTEVGDTVTDGTVVLTCMGKTSLTAGTDYDVRKGGIVVLDAAEFTDGETLSMGYTKALASKVQLLVASGKEYRLVFIGENEARAGKKFKVEAHRVKPGFFQQLSLIGEDYAAMEVAIELLADATKGAGLSKYAFVDIEE